MQPESSRDGILAGAVFLFYGFYQFVNADDLVIQVAIHPAAAYAFVDQTGLRIDQRLGNAELHLMIVAGMQALVIAGDRLLFTGHDFFQIGRASCRERV